MINYNMNRVLSALAAFVGIDQMPMGRAYANRRPTGAKLRNPECPFHAERIAKAQAKRERKAAKLRAAATQAFEQNPALDWCTPTQVLKLNPFYVNR